MKRVFSGSAMIFAALFSTHVFADCPESVRKETPQEAAFYQKVQGQLGADVDAVDHKRMRCGICGNQEVHNG